MCALYYITYHGVYLPYIYYSHYRAKLKERNLLKETIERKETEKGREKERNSGKESDHDTYTESMSIVCKGYLARVGVSLLQTFFLHLYDSDY